MKKRHAKNLKNNGLIKLCVTAWFIFFVFVTIGYSRFTSALGATGIATIERHIYDYVYISRSSIHDSSNASSINYSFTDHEVKANISATACNSYVTYELEIVNSTNYKAFITSASLANQVNGQGSSSSSISAEFIDASTNENIVINETYIAPHSTKIVYLKLKNNCSGGDSSNLITANFTYSLYHFFDLTVTCTDPANATISITTAEGTFTGTGSFTHRVPEGDTATYTVTKEDYYDGTGSYTMGTNDYTETVSLEKKIYLRFNANGGQVSVDKKALRVGDTLGELPVPTKTNGIFIGWFDADPAAHDSSKNYQNNPILYYADKYGDIYNAYGYDENKLYEHYLNNGTGENRRTSQYISTDISDLTTDRTVYAGWIYKWDKYDKKKAWDETLTVADTESGRIAAGSYFAYKERAKLDEIVNVDDQKLHFTEGHSSSIFNPLPDHDTYVFASNSDAIKSGSSGEYVVNHFCIIKNSRVTLWAYITCDIYEVSNIRWVKGDNFIENLYNCDSSTYPSNNYTGDYWYILQ